MLLTVFGGVLSAAHVVLIRAVVLELHRVVQQLLFHSLNQWVLAVTAATLEVVHVHRPDHYTSEAFLLQPVHLHGFIIVIAQVYHYNIIY